jgi:site-specific recombinase XerD
MTLTEAIGDYRNCARHELGHSRSTFNSYSSKLNQFAHWLAENGHPDPPVHESSRETIRRYSFNLANQGMRPRTIAGTLHALRCLWGYLVKQRVLEENVAALIRMPKLDASSRKTLFHAQPTCPKQRGA